MAMATMSASANPLNMSMSMFERGSKLLEQTRYATETVRSPRLF